MGKKANKGNAINFFATNDANFEKKIKTHNCRHFPQVSLKWRVPSSTLFDGLGWFTWNSEIFYKNNGLCTKIRLFNPEILSDAFIFIRTVDISTSIGSIWEIGWNVSQKMKQRSLDDALGKEIWIPLSLLFYFSLKKDKYANIREAQGNPGSRIKLCLRKKGFLFLQA